MGQRIEELAGSALAASKRSLHETVPVARGVLAGKEERPDRSRKVGVAEGRGDAAGRVGATHPWVVVPGGEQRHLGVQLQVGTEPGELLDPTLEPLRIGELSDGAGRSDVGGDEGGRLAMSIELRMVQKRRRTDMTALGGLGARRRTKSLAFWPKRTDSSASAVGPRRAGSKWMSASGAVGIAITAARAASSPSSVQTFTPFSFQRILRTGEAR